MKRKSKNTPGQLSIFDQVIYRNRVYNDLKKAMISAMQDFYISKIYPPEIFTTQRTYTFKDMRRFWNLHELYETYVC